MSEDTPQNERLRPTSIYETVREEGEEELSRPLSALWWSGVAAGVAISMSLVVKAIIAARLPDAEWAPLIYSFGYAVGFVIVVLGRLQLFTENTITVILPLASERSWHNLMRVARLWAIVLAANLAGTFTFALAAVVLQMFGPENLEAFAAVARDATDGTPWATILGDIPAGFLIAAMVWMLPNGRGSEFFIVLAITYVIGLGEFSHVIVGSADAFILILHTGDSVPGTMFGFFVPTLIGNIIGGTALFTVLAYCQVKDEVE